MRISDPQLVDRLASAYVLGTLAGGARKRFEGLLRERADIALAVSGWQARLGRLAGAVPPVEPPPRAWQSIAARTRPPAAAAASADARPWWQPAGWGLAGIATGVLACVALLSAAPGLLFTPDQVALRAGGKLPHSYVGLLTDAQGNGKLLVSSLRHGRVMTVKAIGPIEAPLPGQQLVLWAVPAEGAPFVLGSVPQNGSSVSELPDTSEKLLSKVGKLLVTVEATARPAAPGTVVYAGNCAKLW
jgi:anti-sigma-K factor RskA